MSSIWVKFANWRNGNHGAAYRTRLFVYDEYVPASDLAAARAENERLTKERDEARIWHSKAKEAVERLSDVTIRAEKAESERDEARSMLADAERDMRQRAAEFVGQEARTFPANVAWGVEDVAKAILALPLKHADREEGA